MCGKRQGQGEGGRHLGERLAGRADYMTRISRSAAQSDFRLFHACLYLSIRRAPFAFRFFALVR
jgi:hypothetical protein